MKRMPEVGGTWGRVAAFDTMKNVTPHENSRTPGYWGGFPPRSRFKASSRASIISSVAAWLNP